MFWTPIWHQAITHMLSDGILPGRKKTVCFKTKVYANGNNLRMRFCNIYGKKEYKIGAITVISNGKFYDITVNGDRSFSVPQNGFIYSDTIPLSLSYGDEIEIRIYYLSFIADSNLIEEEATVISGNVTHKRFDKLPMKKHIILKIIDNYNIIPAIDTIELETAERPKVIVAFGDSITAMNRWCKPLADRIHREFGSEFAFLNAGINGNCLIYETPGMLNKLFGEMGTARFKRDVLDIENLDCMIFGLGVNDVAYLNSKTKDIITFEKFTSAVTEMVNKLHERNVRVTMQTITPRLGTPKHIGDFTQEMENLRLEINEWIRNADIFDYVFDAEKAVMEVKNGRMYYSDKYHQGDYLHPNKAGGLVLANAFDIYKLTNKSPNA